MAEKITKALSAWFVSVLAYLMLHCMGVDANIALNLDTRLSQVLADATDMLVAEAAKRLLDFGYRMWPEARHARRRRAVGRR